MRALELDIAGAARSASMRSASAIRRVGVSNSLLGTIATATIVTALLAMAGWAVARGHLAPILAVIVVAPVAWLALRERGVLIGILLLAAMNGIPEIDTSHRIVNHFTAQDLAICTLILTALAFTLLDRTPYRPTRAGYIAMTAAALLLIWCLVVVGRTIVSKQVPLLTTVAFARDYIYFALLLLVLPRVRLTDRNIGALLATLTIGVCMFAVAQTAIAVGVHAPRSLIHVGHTLEQDGLRRVYADMTDLVTAGLAISLAAALLAPQRRLRSAARPVALLLAASTAVQLTRARWIGLLAGLILVTAWLVWQSDRGGLGTVLRQRIAAGLGAICLLGGILVLAVPSILSSSPFIERITSISATTKHGANTVAVRETVAGTMTHYLGGQWLDGLGFISPNAHYFLGLPHGSIEDPDLGVLNAIMPMGAIGAALIYLPVLLILLQCLRRSAGGRQYAWLCYGGATWLVAALVSSVTLVTMFSTSGLALMATFLTVLARVVGKRTPEAAPCPRT